MKKLYNMGGKILMEYTNFPHAFFAVLAMVFNYYTHKSIIENSVTANIHCTESGIIFPCIH
jgi:hypothetical protein